MQRQVIFDNEEQLSQIQEHLVEHETLYAVLECQAVTTSFVGITDGRLILYAPGFLGSRAKTMISIPYPQISAIGLEGGGIMSAPKLLFTTAAAHKYELGFTRDRLDYAYKTIVAHVIGKAP